mmetsp:Transcript_27380/g.58412  ORF Transcript_27380/g.58412 Transcript_27380/m.58412 type:complete len:88 (-) Transcript_27380:692-955(-)
MLGATEKAANSLEDFEVAMTDATAVVLRALTGRQSKQRHRGQGCAGKPHSSRQTAHRVLLPSTVGCTSWLHPTEAYAANSSDGPTCL